MAAYARQAKDSELIRYATEIKVRAERRCGKLLATIDRAPGARTDTTSSKPETKYQEAPSANEIAPATAARYQQLAAMPAAFSFFVREGMPTVDDWAGLHALLRAGDLVRRFSFAL